MSKFNFTSSSRFITNRTNILLPSVILQIVISTLFYSCNDSRELNGAQIDKYREGIFLEWSSKMADSEKKRLGTSLMVGGSDNKAKWRYTTGLILKSFLDLWQETENNDYLTYVELVMNSFIKSDGTIKKYKMSDYNLDKINSGKVLLQLYKITNDQKFKYAADTLREQLQNQPRTSDGGFWHKKRYPWQMWLDGIYMSSPFYCEYAKLFNEPAVFEDVVLQIIQIDQKTRDPETGLRYHGWDESNKQAWADPKTGCSPHFWGRAMGWYMMALVDVLDYFPEQYEQRDQITFILKDVAGALKKYQHVSGLWYQVIDQGDRKGNYLESSCSAMFVYAFAKAVNKGYLDISYRDIAFRGYNELLSRSISEDSDGNISLNNICSVAGLGGDPYRDGSFEYYINEPVVANDLKGVGPFIMAGLQMEQLFSQKEQ